MKPKHKISILLGAVLAVPVLLVGALLAREAQSDHDRKTLITAIRDGDTETTLEMLRLGTDVDSRELPADHISVAPRLIDYLTGRHKKSEGKSALLLAVEKSNHAVTLELLRRGAHDIYAQAKDGTTPWTYGRDNPEIPEALEQATARR